MGGINNVNSLTTNVPHHMKISQLICNESTRYSCLDVKKILVRNRRNIWSLSDCNGINGWVIVYRLSGCGVESLIKPLPKRTTGYQENATLHLLKFIKAKTWSRYFSLYSIEQNRPSLCSIWNKISMGCGTLLQAWPVTCNEKKPA